MSQPGILPGSATAADPAELARIVLRGIGQVMFQGHALTGLLFLVGIAVASPLLAVGAVLGAVIGPGLAYLLKFPRQEIQDGLYGFNATLVGIAVLFYLKPDLSIWGLLLLGTALSSLVTHAARRCLPFPTYTAPFIVTIWLVFSLAHAVAGRSIDVKPAPLPKTPAGFVQAVLDGEAQVMFGANSLTGLLFLAGIAVSNWRHAVIALLGSVAGTALAYYHNDPEGAISIGLYGYNAALAAMAIYLWRKSLLLPLLGALVSVPITEFFPQQLGIPTLTAPFVAAAWIVLAIGALEPHFARD